LLISIEDSGAMRPYCFVAQAESATQARTIATFLTQKSPH
jgi:hypothetical protein